MTASPGSPVGRAAAAATAAASLLLACLVFGATITAALWLFLLPWQAGTAAGPLAAAMADAILGAAPQLVAAFATIPMIAKLSGLLARAVNPDRSA